MTRASVPFLEVWDESAGANLGRRDATALATGSWLLLAGAYDGSGASTGLRVYLDASRVDDTDQSAGTYTAMEDSTSLVRLAFSQGASAGTGFWKGGLALGALSAKELTAPEVWTAKEIVNSYFGLSL